MPNFGTPEWFAAQVERETSHIDRGNGRSLQELFDSEDPLEGEEAQRLRNYATSTGVAFSMLDAYGRALASGNLLAVQMDFVNRVARLMRTTDSMEEAKAAAAEEISKLRWGPTRVPLFDLLLCATLLMPFGREGQLLVTRWLAMAAKIPVNGRDVTGTTAMHHAISTQPALDLEFAQILYDAGGEVNERNRYGCTPVHEMCMISDARTPQEVRPTRDAMRWFLSHGGNLEIEDNEGTTPRSLFMTSRAMWKRIRNPPIEAVYKIIQEDDRRRKRLGDRCCALCGREPDARTRLVACPRCKKVKYCGLPRECQDLHWPKHKKTCKTAEDLAQEEVRQHMYVGVPNILVRVRTGEETCAQGYTHPTSSLFLI